MGTVQEMTVVMMMIGCPQEWSDIHPDRSLPKLLVTPMADTKSAEFDADTPADMAAEGKWV